MNYGSQPSSPKPYYTIYNTPTHIRPIATVLFVYLTVKMLTSKFIALLVVGSLFYLIASFGSSNISLNGMAGC